MANQDLADGLVCAVYLLKGDSDFYANELKLHHYNSNALCDDCPAGRDAARRDLLYNKCDNDAAWPKMLYSPTDWAALYIGYFMH